MIPKIVHGGYYQSGQSCISVQRLLVRQVIYAHSSRVATLLWSAIERLATCAMTRSPSNSSSGYESHCNMPEPRAGASPLVCLHQDHYEVVKAKLTKAVAALKAGSPHDEDTYIGPIIAVKEAERIEAWVKEAIDKGA